MTAPQVVFAPNYLASNDKPGQGDHEQSWHERTSTQNGQELLNANGLSTFTSKGPVGPISGAIASWTYVDVEARPVLRASKRLVPFALIRGLCYTDALDRAGSAMSSGLTDPQLHAVEKRSTRLRRLGGAHWLPSVGLHDHA